MKNKASNIRLCFVLACLLIFHSASFAQLKANFSSSVVAGCSPMVVQFNDISTGSPVSYLWDFGNGSTSTLQNPGAVYQNAGSYTIKLTVKNASGAQDVITKAAYITAYAKPTIDFSATPNSGCGPLPVQFTDKSVAGSGTKDTWAWDFGDGQISTDQNPLHVYTTIDTFSVSLTVTNSFGCSDIVQRPAYVTVNGISNPDFAYTYKNACSPPTQVNFTNSNTASSPISYQWSFGDGGLSSEQNPGYTYSTRGTFDIQLILSTIQGCNDTVTKSIAVGTVTPNFTTPLGGCANKKLNFADSSTPSPLLLLWDFGDGTTSTGLNVSHKFLTSGSYNVKMVADFGGCTDSITKVFTVTDKPTAALTASNNRLSCKFPANISFHNASMNGITYIWNFGDGKINTVVGLDTQHVYNRAGVYDVTLIAQNFNGCSDTSFNPRFVQLGPPRISNLLNAPFLGCAPVDVILQPNISSGEVITNYNWDFGDGTTSTDSIPKHHYVSEGAYNVTVSVKTTSGCTDTSVFPNIVRIGQKPNAKFSVAPSDACASQIVQFTDRSTGNITSWHWKFGDTSVFSGLQNPSHHYNDTGKFTITLLIESNGCMDSAQLTDYVHISPPVARFQYKFLCGQRLTRNFIDGSVGAKTWDWDFGDGSPHATIQSPTHIFTGSGNFTVRLTVTNGACSATAIDSLSVSSQTPSFDYSPQDTTLCRNDTLRFTATKYDTSFISLYYWNFGDGTNSGFHLSNAPVTHKYNRTGTFTPFLVLRDVAGCKDTIRKAGLQVNVYGPTASFLTSNGACVNNAITFTDRSFPDKTGLHRITAWTWNYGDGTTETLSGPPFQHVYTTAGIYDVRLKLQDSFGCIDSAFRKNADTISKPIVNFSLKDSIRCSASGVNFVDSSAGFSLTYNWDFGDGTGSALAAPFHKYPAEGVYSVGLGITDRFGCKDSTFKTNFVTIADPRATIIIDKDSTSKACPPIIINPVSGSTASTFLTWDFGDGNTSNLSAPTHTYTLPGSYSLRLIAQGHGNCFDTAYKLIKLAGPSGSFAYAPNNFCSPNKVSFSASGHSVVGFQWFFGDGDMEASTDSNITHIYTKPGKYLPSLLILDSTQLCSIQLVNILDTIRVSGIIANFGVATTPGCDSTLVYFTDSSIAYLDTLKTRVWNFGDNTTSNIPNPVHQYNTSGTKNVSIILTSKLGCRDTLNMPVDVVVNQSPIINMTIPPLACVNSAAGFDAGNTSVPPGTINWVWQFGNGDTSHIKNPSHAYKAANAYNVTLVGTNEFGCADTTQGSITVQPLPLVDAGADSTICLGQSVTLQAAGAGTYTWAADNTLSCTACANPVAKPGTTDTYYVTGTSAAGCTAIDSITLLVKQPFTVTASPNDSLCIGASVQLIAQGAEVYSWSPATGLDNPSIANPRATPSATTTYTVTGTDVKNCFSSAATVVVNIFPNPAVNITDSVVSLAVGSKLTLATTSSPDITIWKWTPATGLSCTDCAQPVASPTVNTTYSVNVSNQYNCSASDRVTVVVLCDEKNLFIPNTFSPNGDNMNDYFYPRGLGLFAIRSMRVFNRWGQIVFERKNFSANDKTTAWDGTYNGKLQTPGVYIYIIEVICGNGTVLKAKGDVTLLH